MSPQEVLRAVRARGVEVWAEGSALRYRTVKGPLTADTQSLLASYKPALLKFLGGDLEGRIRGMAERWGYSPEEFAYARQKAAEDPIAWRDFVADDERWCATRH